MPGASAYFLGGAVVYTRRARRALVAIPDDAVAGMRSSSEPYAALLAQTVRTQHRATWGLSETGATGPTGNRYGDAAGHPAQRFLLPSASPDARDPAAPVTGRLKLNNGRLRGGGAGRAGGRRWRRRVSWSRDPRTAAPDRLCTVNAPLPTDWQLCT